MLCQNEEKDNETYALSWRAIKTKQLSRFVVTHKKKSPSDIKKPNRAWHRETASLQEVARWVDGRQLGQGQRLGWLTVSPQSLNTASPPGLHLQAGTRCGFNRTPQDKPNDKLPFLRKQKFSFCCSQPKVSQLWQREIAGPRTQLSIVWEQLGGAGARIPRV